MSFLDRLREAAEQERAPRQDPWQRRLEGALARVQAISTAALLDLLDATATSGNARRLAAVMRELDFIPIKSRQLMPGGFRDTVTRGWARPMRRTHQSSTRCKGDTAGLDGRPGQTIEGGTR